MRKLRTITIGELIDLLQDQDPDAQVLFTANYGDRGHTAQALPIHGEIDDIKEEGLTVAESGYSISGFAIVSKDENSDDATDPTYVVIR